MGQRALLMIDGGAPRTLAPGEAVGGVKLVSVGGDQAVVDIGGRRHTLRVGEAPANVGGAAPLGGGDRIVIAANSGGHFMTRGSINDRPVEFMVDTGATLVALAQSDADRLGLDYKGGQRVTMGTANGSTLAWRTKLARVRVGDVTVYEVDAAVTPQSMPFVLLGNSFLARFSMRRDSDQLTLQRR